MLNYYGLKGVKMKIITIIPAYNEENAIENVVKGALKYSDVMVVNDGSQDHTSKRAIDAGARVIKHDKNLGKGAAIKSGLKNASKYDYNVIILIDGDGQHNPEHIPLLASYINDFGMVLGSRFKDGNPENMPVQRRLSNKITTKLIRYVTGYELTDSQSGFRALSANASGLFLDIKYDDYVYESEMLYIASKNNIEIVEIPIPSIYGLEKSYVSKIHVLRYLLFIVNLFIRRIRNNQIFNPYFILTGE
jgi:glycosyltransferase involved in cell wall biosynthesis